MSEALQGDQQPAAGLPSVPEVQSWLCRAVPEFEVNEDGQLSWHGIDGSEALVEIAVLDVSPEAGELPLGVEPMSDAD